MGNGHRHLVLYWPITRGLHEFEGKKLNGCFLKEYIIDDRRYNYIDRRGWLIVPKRVKITSGTEGFRMRPHLSQSVESCVRKPPKTPKKHLIIII